MLSFRGPFGSQELGGTDGQWKEDGTGVTAGGAPTARGPDGQGLAGVQSPCGRCHADLPLVHEAPSLGQALDQGEGRGDPSSTARIVPLSAEALAKRSPFPGARADVPAGLGPVSSFMWPRGRVCVLLAVAPDPTSAPGEPACARLSSPCRPSRALLWWALGRWPSSSLAVLCFFAVISLLITEFYSQTRRCSIA